MKAAHSGRIGYKSLKPPLQSAHTPHRLGLDVFGRVTPYHPRHKEKQAFCDSSAELAGLYGDKFTGHSIQAGFLTAAARRG
jgi:hypothetical protein